MRSNDDGRRVVDASGRTAEWRTSGLLRAREMGGFDLHSGRIDVRRWSVVSADAKLVGTVDAILVEIKTRRVRYLIIELLPAPNARSTTRTLVPIGLAHRLDARQLVVLSRVTAMELAAAPRVSARRPITRSDELDALYAFGLRALNDSTRDLYTGSGFDETAVLS